MKNKKIEKYLWKLCLMINKRISKWEEIEGYPPIDGTDVCGLTMDLIDILNSRKDKKGGKK